MSDGFVLKFGIAVLIMGLLAGGAVIVMRLRQDHWRYFSEKRLIRKRRTRRARSWTDPLGGPKD